MEIDLTDMVRESYATLQKLDEKHELLKYCTLTNHELVITSEKPIREEFTKRFSPTKEQREIIQEEDEEDREAMTIASLYSNYMDKMMEAVEKIARNN